MIANFTFFQVTLERYQQQYQQTQSATWTAFSADGFRPPHRSGPKGDGNIIKPREQTPTLV